jgi:hypothetical protein
VLMTTAKTTGKLTIAKSGSGMVIRVTGKLLCDCGTPVQALDVRLEEAKASYHYNLDPDDEDLVLVDGPRIICSGCHQDLLEITEV